MMEKTVLQPKILHKPFSTYSHGIAVDGAKRIQLGRHTIHVVRTGRAAAGAS